MSAAFPIPSVDEDDIVAYVVPTERTTLTVDKVNVFAVETMPKYMRPRHVRIVDDIPRTPTNKVEKYRLRQRILAELRERRAEHRIRPVRPYASRPGFGTLAEAMSGFAAITGEHDGPVLAETSSALLRRQHRGCR